MAKRVSLAGADAMKSGFGIQEGTVRVEDARFKTVQHVKGDGTLVTPFTALQFDVCKLNAAGDAETEVEVKDFIVGWGSKEQTENGQHKFKFRPGVVANATADEVEDQGDESAETCEIGAEGNTFCSTSGGSPFEDSDAVLLMKSLEAHGWKPEINKQAYAPNYVGATFDVRTVLKEDLCKRLGVRYNSPKEKAKNDPTCWEVVKIHVRPYEASKGGGKGKGTAASTAAAKSTASAPASAGKTNGAASKDDPAMAVFEQYVRDNKGTAVKRQDMMKFMAAELVGAIGMKDANTWVKANLKSDDDLEMLCTLTGAEFDADKGVVQF